MRLLGLFGEPDEQRAAELMKWAERHGVTLPPAYLPRAKHAPEALAFECF